MKLVTKLGYHIGKRVKKLDEVLSEKGVEDFPEERELGEFGKWILQVLNYNPMGRKNNS